MREAREQAGPKIALRFPSLSVCLSIDSIVRSGLSLDTSPNQGGDRLQYPATKRSGE